MPGVDMKACDAVVIFVDDAGDVGAIGISVDGIVGNSSDGSDSESSEYKKGKTAGNYGAVGRSVGRSGAIGIFVGIVPVETRRGGDEFHLGFELSFVKVKSMRERELFEIGELRGDLLEDDIKNLKRSERFRSEDVIEMKKNDVHI
ncbi:hypothetical protein Tco_0600894 [Tanacetum coccineum]